MSDGGDASMELVVAGHGPAGHRLVEALCERDTARSWKITVIGEEPRAAYHRVRLTSYLTEDAAAWPAPRTTRAWTW